MSRGGAETSYVAFLLVAFSAVARDVAAQACSSCDVRRARVATLGRASDAELLGAGSVPLRLPDGRYLSHPQDRSQLLVYGAAGVQTRVVGGRGGGPGEFDSISRMFVGRGDSVYIQHHRRLDVFTPELRYARTVVFVRELEANLQTVALRSGDLVAIPAAPRARDFMHIVTSDGERIRSFGASRVTEASCGLCQVRMVAVSADSGFFAVPPNEYVIEHWTGTGESKRVHAISSTWFPRGRVSRSAGGSEPPAPILVGLTQDSAGRLWVVGRIANERWRPVSVPFSGSIGGRGVISANSPAANRIPDPTGYTTVVDAIDPATGAVLSTARFDGELLAPMAGGLLYGRREDAEGYILLDIWKLELVPRGQ